MSVALSRDELLKLSVPDLAYLDAEMKWRATARDKQIPPQTEWPIWLLNAGRGFGKTAVGCNWARWKAYNMPGSIGHVVARTSSDLRRTVYEGPAGLLAAIPESMIKTYNRGFHELVLHNGSKILGFSAEEPDRLRGPQCHWCLCDELAAWVYVRATWDQVIFSTRLRYVVTEAPPAASQDYSAEPAIIRGDDGTVLVGPEAAPIATPVGKARNAHIKAPNAAVQTRIIEPQIVITTTPRPLPIIRELRNRADVVVTLGSSYENKVNLADSFFKEIIKYEGTVIGRQEIHGELIDPEEAGIVKRSWFKLWPAGTPMPVFDYIVYSLDTAFTEKTWDKKKGESDFSACTVWGVFASKNTDGKLSRHNIFLIDCWREKYGLPGLIERVRKETAIHYGAARPAIRPRFGESKQRGTGRKADVILIEDKGSGISLRQMLTREHIHTTPYNPGKASKLDRLHAVSHVANSGIVWLPQSETPDANGQLRQQPKDWIDDWLAEVCTYCGDGSTDYDDYVDSTTQAWRLIADRFLARGVEQKPVEDDVAPPKDNSNPYLR